MSEAYTQVREFDDHRFVARVEDPKSHLSAYIALHRGDNGFPSFGATRIAVYGNDQDALRDALRLSRLMSYKAAMAGVKYGGAKGVIIANPKALKSRGQLLGAYANRVSMLGGKFVTGADLGVSAHDVKIMKKATPFVVGVEVDPVLYTAIGIHKGIEVCLQEVFGSSSLNSRSIAIQGLGKIGSSLLSLVYKHAKRIYAADINPLAAAAAKKKYPKIELMSPDKILYVRTDIVSPCAMGPVLNKGNIGKIKAAIVAGGANGQLTEASVGDMLHNSGILYAPDYVLNGGGLISVVDEYENHNQDEQRLLKRLENIPTMLRKIFTASKQTGNSTNAVADSMAERIFNKH